MKGRTGATACLVPLALCGSLLGGECRGESLTQVYRMAQVHDTQFQSARKNFEAAMEKLPQARAGLLPTVNLTAGKNPQSGQASFAYEPYVSRDIQAWSWSLQLTQPLVRWGNWASYQQADAQVRQAQEQFSTAGHDLILRVAQSYLDVVAAIESVGVVEAQLRAINEQMALAERNFSVGTGTVTDVHEARAKLFLTRAQQVTANNEVTSKQAEIERLLGQPVTVPPMRFTKDLPLLREEQLARWLGSAATQNPLIRMHQAAVEAAQQEVAKSRAAHLPTLDLTANRAASFNSGSLSSPADLATRVSSHQLGLQLNVPLFAGGAMQSRVRESAALEEKAREDLLGTQRTTGAQVRQAFAGVMNGQSQIEALQVALEAGRNAVEGNKIGFRLGTRINSEVLNAEQQFYATMRDLTKARIETMMQGLKLRAAAGSLHEDDLIALESLLEAIR